MLIERSVTVGGATVTILENPEECGICHRTRTDCLARPWRNHTFQPANCDARQVPGNWIMLPRVTEAELKHHRLDRPRHPREQIASVIHITPNQGTLT